MEDFRTHHQDSYIEDFRRIWHWSVFELKLWHFWIEIWHHQPDRGGINCELRMWHCVSRWNCDIIVSWDCSMSHWVEIVCVGSEVCHQYSSLDFDSLRVGECSINLWVEKVEKLLKATGEMSKPFLELIGIGVRKIAQKWSKFEIIVRVWIVFMITVYIISISFRIEISNITGQKV